MDDNDALMMRRTYKQFYCTKVSPILLDRRGQKQTCRRLARRVLLRLKRYIERRDNFNEAGDAAILTISARKRASVFSITLRRRASLDLDNAELEPDCPCANHHLHRSPLMAA